VFSGICQPRNEELDAGDHKPGFSTCDGVLEIFGEPSVAVELGECAFHDPSAWQNFEALCDIGSLDDLQCPAPDALEGVIEFLSRVAAVSEDMAQPRDLGGDFIEMPLHGLTVVAR